MSAVVGALLAIASPAAGQQNASDIPTFGPLDPKDCHSEVLCETWMGFRRQHGVPYQSIAIRIEPGEGYADVILSEPSPAVSAADLEAAIRSGFGDRVVTLSRFRMRTGLDGWLGDMAFRVKLMRTAKTEIVSGQTLQPMLVSTDLADGLWRLYALMHGTTDGFWLDDIAAAQPDAKVPELKIASKYLLDRFADTTGDWKALDDIGAKVPTSALKLAKTAAAYRRDDGLVVLALPQKLSLDDAETPFTRFAVASDLLLGAVRVPAGPLLLVGRARAVPLSVLPPLRWETFTMLARNADDELDQSYERQRIFAGKIQAGPYQSWDWAPILLSYQLDDSELGTLLDQADQILKSWSQHGVVQYLSFNYPAPGAYPFGDKSASDFFLAQQGATSLVFNWNTNDFGMIVASDRLEALAADRTGALSILYLPGGASQSVSDTDGKTLAETEAVRARDVFAAQGDATLARVAQNILLGQAVRNMLSLAEAPAAKRPARSDRTAAVLDREAQAWLARVVQGTERIEPAAHAILVEAQRSSTLTPAIFASYIAVPQRLDAELLALDRRARTFRTQGEAAAAASISAIEDSDTHMLAPLRRACVQSGGTVSADGTKCGWRGTAEQNAAAGKNFDARANALRAPFEARIAAAENQLANAKSGYDAVVAQQNRLATLAHQFDQLSSILGHASGDAKLDQILPAVLAASASVPSGGWIQTPSVVLSRNGENVESIGGHNARLTPSRAKLRADGGLVFSEVNGAKLAKGAERIVPPSADSAAPPVSLAAGDGKLFSLLQARQQAAVAPDLLAQLLSKTEGCPSCDQSYIYDGGTIYEIGLKPPPPTVTVLPGKTVMAGRISQAAHDRPPLTAQFVNFPQRVIDDVTVMADRLGGPPGGRFVPTPPLTPSPAPADGRVIAIVERQQHVETLDARGPDGKTAELPGGTVHAVDAQATAAGDQAVRQEFGDAAASADAVTIVTFQGAAGPTRVAIAVSGGSDKAGLPARLLATVKAWLPDSQQISLLQQLVDLRRILKQKLDSKEYNFLMRGSAGAITIVLIDTLATPA